MMNNESQCVTIKRKGAEHVRKLLDGKSMEEELRFWADRTKKMKAAIKKRATYQTVPQSKSMICHETPDKEPDK